MVEHRPWLTFLAHAILVIGCLLIAFPIYTTFVASTHSLDAITTSFPYFPGRHLIENYQQALTAGSGEVGVSVARMMLNSAIMAFGIAFALWYLRKHRIPTWKIGDLAGPALALGHGFGRIGCFSAGCCFGRECDVPWGVTFQNEYAHNLTGIPQGTVLHPTQLYEAFLNFANFLILFFILKRKRFDGQVFSLYIVNYSVIRYFVEFYRGDHPDKAFLIQNSSPYTSVSLPQLFCIIGFIGGLILYFILKKRKSA